MSAALDAGRSVTALHNHFFYDEPKGAWHTLRFTRRAVSRHYEASGSASRFHRHRQRSLCLLRT